MTYKYVTKEELIELNSKYKFDESTVQACNAPVEHLRSMVESYDNYTFGILHIVNDFEQDDDWIGLYVKSNLVLVVDILDKDGSTKNTFNDVVDKAKLKKLSAEKVIAAFFEKLTTNDVQIIEDISKKLSKLEESLLAKDIVKDYNVELLIIKKHLQRLHYYYEHILDIAQLLYENENGILDPYKLIYINNMVQRIERLNEDTISLTSSVEHLQDAYFSYMDIKMNNTMKLLTVLTTLFFPLTIIVGWYGMNFKYMPEFAWRFGYIYVILLSIAVIIAFLLIGKRKKWFK